MMKKNSSFVIFKSFENLTLNNFQVINFERMAKNCFVVNILSKKFAEMFDFQWKQNDMFVCNNINKRLIKIVFKYFLLFADAYITSATCWEEIISLICYFYI